MTIANTNRYIIITLSSVTDDFSETISNFTDTINDWLPLNYPIKINRRRPKETYVFFNTNVKEAKKLRKERKLQKEVLLGGVCPKQYCNKTNKNVCANSKGHPVKYIKYEGHYKFVNSEIIVM